MPLMRIRFSEREGFIYWLCQKRTLIWALFCFFLQSLVTFFFNSYEFFWKNSFKRVVKVLKGWFAQKNFWNSCDAEHFQKSLLTYFSFLKKVLKLHRLNFPKIFLQIFFWIFPRKKKTKYIFNFFHENEKSLVSHRIKISKKQKKKNASKHIFWKFCI